MKNYLTILLPIRKLSFKYPDASCLHKLILVYLFIATCGTDAVYAQCNIQTENLSICFPADITVNCQDEIILPDLVYEEGEALISISTSTERFSASGNECYKLFITYRIVNWCYYNGEDDPVVISRDIDCDGNPGDENICVIVRPDGVTYYDRNGDENDTDPAAGTSSIVCYGSTNPAGYWLDSNIDPRITSNGYFQYTQIVEVYDTDPPVLPVVPADITVSEPSLVPPPEELTAFDCNDNDITVMPQDQIITGADQNNYTILRTWTFEDQCLNSDFIQQTIVVDENLEFMLECPMSEVLEVAATCGYVYDFNVTASSLLPPGYSVAQIQGDPSGTLLYAGVYNYEFQILDNFNRPISRCTWSVTVSESDDVGGDISCMVDPIIITFEDMANPMGELTLDASHFLESSSCEVPFLFITASFPSGEILNGPTITFLERHCNQPISITVMGPNGINSCNTSLFLENRSIPTLSEWGMLILIMVLMIFGIVYIQQRSTLPQ